MIFFPLYVTTAAQIAAATIGLLTFHAVISFVVAVVSARIAYVLTSWAWRNEVPEWLQGSTSDSKVGCWQRFKIQLYLSVFRAIYHINTLHTLMSVSLR